MAQRVENCLCCLVIDGCHFPIMPWGLSHFFLLPLAYFSSATSICIVHCLTLKSSKLLPSHTYVNPLFGSYPLFIVSIVQLGFCNHRIPSHRLDFTFTKGVEPHLQLRFLARSCDPAFPQMPAEEIMPHQNHPQPEAMGGQNKTGNGGTPFPAIRLETTEFLVHYGFQRASPCYS